MSRCTILVVLLGLTATASSETRSDPATPAFQGGNEAIVGGDTVPPGKWPDTVAVLGDGSCTGTLIAPDIVLTAGHCADMNPTTVIANTIDYSKTGGTRVSVERTVAYPSWETTYDVAIVILSQPITSVAPRAVGTDCTLAELETDMMVRLVGFGATSMDGTAANTLLKEAMAPVLDPMCASGNGCNPSVAPGGEFIAGGTGTADSCFGDSGGPVYLETSRGPVVIGAVSRGVDNAATPCGGGGIYVRTDKIIDWIEETAGKAIEKDSCVGGPDDDGTGNGTGSGSGTGEGEEFAADGDSMGGCSTTGTGSIGSLAFAALALAGGRRRRRALAAKPAEAKPAEDPITFKR